MIQGNANEILTITTRFAGGVFFFFCAYVQWVRVVVGQLFASSSAHSVHKPCPSLYVRGDTCLMMGRRSYCVCTSQTSSTQVVYFVSNLLPGGHQGPSKADRSMPPTAFLSVLSREVLKAQRKSYTISPPVRPRQM